MKRSDFDAVVAALVEETNFSDQGIIERLAKQGIVPDSMPMADSFVETMAVYGMTEDHRPHHVICHEHGWNDPAGIEHVAVAVTKQRRFVALQLEEDGQSQVQLYVYDLLDAGKFWTIETPVVIASS